MATGDLFFPTDGFYVERSTGAAWEPWGPIFPFTAPPSSGWSWVNQGGATVDATKGGIYLEAPAATGDNFRIYVRSAPSTPYSLIAAFIPNLTPHDTSSSCGVLWRQSSDGKLVVARSLIVNNSFRYSKYTNPTTFSADYVSSGTYNYLKGPMVWFKIEDDGTNRKLYCSTNGQFWIELHSVGRTDFMTADQIGFYANAGNASRPAGILLLSWKEA